MVSVEESRTVLLLPSACLIEAPYASTGGGGDTDAEVYQDAAIRSGLREKTILRDGKLVEAHPRCNQQPYERYLKANKLSVSSCRASMRACSKQNHWNVELNLTPRVTQHLQLGDELSAAVEASVASRKQQASQGSI